MVAAVSPTPPSSVRQQGAASRRNLAAHFFSRGPQKKIGPQRGKRLRAKRVVTTVFFQERLYSDPVSDFSILTSGPMPF